MEFRISRFFILSKRDIIVNWKKYISMPVVVFALCFFGMWMKSEAIAGILIFCLLFCVFVTTLPNAFIGYKKEKSRITTLLLPASAEEKWLLEFFKYYLVFPIALFVSSLLGVLVGELVFNQSVEKFNANYSLIEESITFDIILRLYAIITVAFFACLLFKKRSLLKTIVSILAFFIVCSLLQGWLLKDDFVYTLKDFSRKDVMMEYSLALEHHIRVLSNCLYGVVIVVLTAMSYIRLKWEEKA